MKVAYITTYPPTPCGIAEYTSYLIESLRNVCGGSEIYVFSDKDFKNTDQYIGRFGEVIIPSFQRGVSKYDHLIKLIKENGPFNVVHIQHEYGIFPSSAKFIKLIENLKKYADSVLVTLHTVYHKSYEYQERVKHQIELLKAVDAVVVHSSLQEFELLVQIEDPRKLYRIPHGTKINEYIGKITRDDVVQELNLSGVNDEDFLITSPGFLRIDKGLDVLVRAIEIVNQRYDVRLIISGIEQGKYSEKIFEFIKVDGRIPKYLTFIHKFLSKEELEKLLAIVDLIVMPYRSRPGKFSVSGILHLALGSMKPIIGTRTDRLVELYEIAPDLVIRVPDDPKEIAKKIIDFMENRKEYEVYVDILKEYALATSWEKTAIKHVNVYKEVMENH
ncbi:MAG: hypothetical protein DRN30_00005 [Thermoplasmata archaeon]|nr:glycosyltransferase [Euryarchaeota archaeon]RLF67369.1 MAG: hypothetical protein DRN30_00005 [Thermoplasmata archaeon]